MKMSEIAHVLDQLDGTLLHDILVDVENQYENIAQVQKTWYEKTKFLCPDGCGKCCVGFEPDLMESEVLYMAAWLIENQYENALKIADGKLPFDNGDKTCPLFNTDSPYHCSIYGGRAFICRLFGASSFYDKTQRRVWKPCRFYPADALRSYSPLLSHRQFSEDEVAAILGDMPPAMSDLMQMSETATESNKTVLLREILPETISRILWVIHMNGNDNPNGTPSAPIAA